MYDIKVVNLTPPFDTINSIVHNLKKVSLIAKVSEEIIVQVYNYCEFKFWNIKNGVLEEKVEYLFDKSMLKVKNKREIVMAKKENKPVRNVFLRYDCNKPYSIAVKNRKIFVSYPSRIVVFNINSYQMESIISVNRILRIFELRSEHIIYQTANDKLFTMNCTTCEIEEKSETIDSENRREIMNYPGNVINKKIII